MNSIEMAAPDVPGLALQLIQLMKKAEPEEIAVLCNRMDYLRNMRTQVTQEGLAAPPTGGKGSKSPTP